ncbi:MAG: GNAT family N-acetyltransferase [Bacillaceae bacterium]
MIETARLYLRKMNEEDMENIKFALQDIEVMYAWEHAFTDEEVREWIEKNITRYKQDGFSYLVAFEKNNGNFIGMMGPLIEQIGDNKHIGVAYILKKAAWHKGFAVEGVKGCLAYAFNELGAKEVIAQIRPTNHASQKVVERLGMKVVDSFVKHYNGKEMEHLIYCISYDEFMK